MDICMKNGSNLTFDLGAGAEPSLTDVSETGWLLLIGRVGARGYLLTHSPLTR